MQLASLQKGGASQTDVEAAHQPLTLVRGFEAYANISTIGNKLQSGTSNYDHEFEPRVNSHLEAVMMIYIASYLGALGLFVIVYTVWLSTMANSLYRTTIGDILLPGVNVAPAVAFYIIYPAGVSNLCSSPRAEPR